MVDLTKIVFPEPQTHQEAQERAGVLRDEITSITIQLGGPRLGEDGQPLPKFEYLQWRQRAKAALAIKQKEAAYLKAWLKENRRPTMSENTGLGAVYALYYLAKDYLKGDEQPSQDHWPIVDEVRDYLRQNGFTL